MVFATSLGSVDCNCVCTRRLGGCFLLGLLCHRFFGSLLRLFFCLFLRFGCSLLVDGYSYYCDGIGFFVEFAGCRPVDFEDNRILGENRFVDRE